MATGEKPIKTYFIINIAVIAIIVFSAGYVYLNFFADNSEEDGEGTDISTEETKPVDLSKQVSKTAFTLAAFLAVTLFVLFMISKFSRSKSEQF